MNSAGSSAVTAGLLWFKSSYSGTEGGDCVEVATAGAAVHIRDSKDTTGPTIAVSHTAWAGLVTLASSDRTA